MNRNLRLSLSIFTISLLIGIVVSCTDGGISKSSNISSIPSISVGASGKGGSMARFALTDTALYVLTNNSLQSYSIKNQASPILQNTVSLDNDMETLFPYDSLLFIGSQSGMYVYTVTSNYSLEYVSNYWHVTSCDPVVFDGTHAYVTLNSAHEMCGRYINQLDIINMEDITAPYQINSYEMESPKGLGVDGRLLFLCDNNSLKIYDKSEPYNIQLKNTFTIPNIYDVIPYRGNLIVTSQSGIVQYSYDTTTLNISYKSIIPVKH
ncbi:MAG: hypothetical protein PF481_09555 [Bacteroidales bacterium]|jgi:hypothetical protein|nr:hypothetical protein [Bacteroidales bacterium]